MDITPQIQELLNQLKDKYDKENQPLESYLEGLLHQNYLDYWEYVNVDALLNLQVMRTQVPDEMIFILYHQITELYFKLVLWEVKQIHEDKNLTAEMFSARLGRMTAYFRNLTLSFGIMIDGMFKEQFLKFRLGLLPASGFQSAQYRLIEMASAPIINLVEENHREEVRGKSIEEQYQYIYWKKGATDAATGAKTLTLRRFEEKYKDVFLRWAKEHENTNLFSVYNTMSTEDKNNPELIKALREYDNYVNVEWPLVHMQSAGRYLGGKDKAAVAATGGTNWKKYLPPRFQRRIFFPELWSEEEKINWGGMAEPV